MGGNNGVVPSCDCNLLQFEVTITSGQYIDLAYQPCNTEVIETVRYTTSTLVTNADGICIGNRNYTLTGTGLVNSSNLDATCLQANCQSCDCYEFFYQISIDAPTYISYIPCNVPSSSREIIGPFASLSTGSFVCSFPWTVIPISGTFDYPGNGPTGVIKQVDSASCQQQMVSGSLEVGDLKGGGMVIYVTGNYPNQNGLIITTQSIALSSPQFGRWGYFGTITGINDKAYGSGANNTVQLRNYTPTTGSIIANALTASINGYSDWFLPSENEATASALNGIVWPVQWSGPALASQPQLSINTKGNSILTSNERSDGTNLQKRNTYLSIATGYPHVTNQYVNKNTESTQIYAFRYFNSSLIT